MHTGFKITDKLIYNFVIFCLFFIYFIYLGKSFDGDFAANEYSYNELFINYQSGFVRRGLLGEIIWQINNFFGTDPKKIFNVTLFICHFIYLVLFLKLLEKVKINFFSKILILLSPVFFLFPIYDTNVYYVKDIFIKITIVTHGLILLSFKNSYKKYDFYLKFFLIPFLSFVIIFIHEYQVLFLSIHFLLSCYFSKYQNFKIKKIIFYYLVLLIPTFLVIAFLGNQSNLEILNNLLEQKFALNIHRQLGGGFVSLFGGFYKWHFFYFSYRDFINLLFSFLFSTVVIYCWFEYLIIKKVIYLSSFVKKNYKYFFVPVFLVFLNLDHGRNLSLLATHLIIFYLCMDLKLATFKKEMFKLNNNFLLKNILFLFSFFYIFLWKLTQNASFGFGGKPNSIFQSSLFSELIKFIKYLYNIIDTNIMHLPIIHL